VAGQAQELEHLRVAGEQLGLGPRIVLLGVEKIGLADCDSIRFEPVYVAVHLLPSERVEDRMKQCGFP
jgi:hypothetical protein